MENIIEEIKIFVNKNFCSPYSKEVKNKAKKYLELIEKGKAFADENYSKHLQNMAN